jgi:hypothetical protein
MPESLYSPTLFSDLDASTVLDRLRREGWDPISITDPPGYIYPPHSHPETKLLSILSGSMGVRVAGEAYSRQRANQTIPGGNQASPTES